MASSKFKLIPLVILSFFIAGLYSYPTQADELKSTTNIGSVFDIVGHIGLKNAREKGLTTAVNKKVTIEDNVITFTESLFDGSKIYIGYIIEPIDTLKVGPDRNGFLDVGISINNGQIGSHSFGVSETRLNIGMYIGMFEVQLSDEYSLPNSFLLGLQSYKDQSLYLELPVERKGHHYSYFITKEKEANDYSLYYDKITFFPTAIEIKYREVMDYESLNSQDPHILSFQIVDDQGRVLQPLSSGGGGRIKGDKFISNSKYYFEPLKKTPKTLTVKPYFVDISTHQPKKVKKKWKGKAFTLSQGKMGQLKILTVEENNDIVNVTYETKGYHAYQQAMVLWIEDTDGNEYHFDEAPKRIEGTTNQYQATFRSMSSIDGELYLNTVKLKKPNYVNEFEIKVQFVNNSF
ncbi:DUF4179 domain-containing protein [Alkalihalobacterium chitinilyticum]|uniref:DUF4179 domain-containing protein n=1 Tax=Alkalihalobacterium chitinilyticum TaxID=2980103 RepID=A0ABT5VGW2_9BACI|nr:DUF4179 domain-containing protein [Alkalihalobacterium chitinilyticum]MDE5414421.1 DUF4179 domain-containing protein [Alkalihalobacterium chitinilyticum]